MTGTTLPPVGRSRPGLWALMGAMLGLASSAGAQDIGHKLPGTAGLDAGSQVEAGFYVVDRFVFYRARELRDRHGEEIPVGLELDAFATVYGLTAAIEIFSDVYVSTAIGVPFAGIWLSTEDPRARIDRLGLADVSLQPAKLGWRGPQLDLVTAYAVSAPTRTFGEGPLARSQWSHQLSVGGTAFFTRARSWRVSLLGTYDLFHSKSRVDVTRGDSVTLQGGLGTTWLGVLDAGVVGYALWQVRDNRGADLPDALREVRDRAFGVGLEANVVVAPLRARIGARWLHDFAVRARPEAQILVTTISFLIGRPRGPPGR